MQVLFDRRFDFEPTQLTHWDWYCYCDCRRATLKFTRSEAKQSTSSEQVKGWMESHTRVSQLTCSHTGIESNAVGCQVGASLDPLLWAFFDGNWLVGEVTDQQQQQTTQSKTKHKKKSMKEYNKHSCR